MKIFIGTDHAGYVLKEKLIKFLHGNGHEVVDKGAFEYDENDDYPDFVIPVAREVAKDPENLRGIVLGATGEAEAVVANKFPHIRAVAYYGKLKSVVDENADVLARSRDHNNSNVLCLGASYLTEDTMMSAVGVWLNTPYGKAERSIRRLGKIDAIKL